MKWFVCHGSNQGEDTGDSTLPDSRLSAGMPDLLWIVFWLLILTAAVRLAGIVAGESARWL
jgi:hypothetical protein